MAARQPRQSLILITTASLIPVTVRRLALASAAATLLITPLRGLAQGGGDAAPPPPRKQIIAFRSLPDRGWAWLTRAGEQVELRAGPPDGEGTLLASGSGWNDLALTSEGTYIAAEVAGRGAILKVDQSTGQEARQVVSMDEVPKSLIFHRGSLYWLGARPSPPGAPAWVPAAGPAAVLQQVGAGGRVENLVELPGLPSPQGPFGQIAGADEAGVLYLTHPLPGSTHIYAVDIAARSAFRVAGTEGLARAVIWRGKPCWSAGSEEAQVEAGIRSVRCWDPALKREQVLTDWMPDMGTLVVRGDELLYSADNLYSAPPSWGPSRRAGPFFAYKIASDGQRLVSLDGPFPTTRPVLGAD